MSNLQSTTSAFAIYAALRGQELSEQTGVSVCIMYNPFEPDELERHQMDWFDGVKLKDYVGDLDPEIEWLVYLNGVEVDPAVDGERDVKNGDHIGVLIVPQGKSVKTILKVIIVAAAIIGAFYLVGPMSWGAIIGTAMMGASVGLMISNLLMPPKMNMPESESDGNSYGIDGAKNSATENVPYPVVYGEFRCAGNFADVYTENSGDDQYLYIRTVLNDGLVHSISDVELNEQPITSFSGAQTRVALGSLDQPVDTWFNRSMSQRNKSARLTTAWTNHITSQPIDKARFELMFPGGLCQIDKKKGTKYSRRVGFDMRYRKLDPVTKQPIGSWTSLAYDNPVSAYNADLTGGVGFAGLRFLAHVRGQAQPTTPGQNPLSGKIRYRKVGTTTWIDVPQVEVPIYGYNYVYDPSNDGSIAGDTDITPMTTHVYDIDVDLDAGEYEFEALDGSVISQIISYPDGVMSSTVIDDSRTKQIRKSIESVRLERGYYEIGIRRQNEPSTDDYIIDDVYLTDVTEIDIDDIRLPGTAYLSLCVKLSDQLNQIPNITAKVKGCILQEYDIEGNETFLRWSANPAWIALDMLLNPARGAGISKTRIDWPAWVELAKYCDQKALYFNGVFDGDNNLGDAIRQVLRIGHAVPIPFGTRISVAVDKARSPVGLINSTSVIDGTFELTYLPMSDRSNEYEVSYFDKNDKNKQKTLRYVDQRAVTFNEIPRKADIQLIGVDNIEQAKNELWRAIYSNRLIIRTVNLEMMMEAISFNIGDVLLISHPMMQWSEDGRLETGSTTTQLKLDRQVEIEAGPLYSVIIAYDALELSTRTVSSVVGKRVMVPTSSLSDAAVSAKVRRMTLAANQTVDFQVIKIEKGAVYDTVYLDTEPTGVNSGASVKFWQTDALEERNVQSATVVDGKTVLTLDTPLPKAPVALQTFIFGKKEEVQRPYVLNAMTGVGIEKRKLTFVEYHEGVYAAAEIEIPTPVSRNSDMFISHVEGLLMDYDRLVEPGRKSIPVRVHWSAGRTPAYGGADIYMSLNGEALRKVYSANDTTEYVTSAAPGDVLTFQVVAFNKKGIRAPVDSAPAVRGTINIVEAILDPPTNVSAQSVQFQVDGKAVVLWSEPADATGVSEYEVQYRQVGSINWTSAGYHQVRRVEIAGLPTGNYEARVRSTGGSEATSEWVQTTFSVVIVPGSLLANWNAANDRNGEPIAAPTLPSTGSVEHTLNTDGTANVSFEWLWGGDTTTIDGFIVTMERS